MKRLFVGLTILTGLTGCGHPMHQRAQQEALAATAARDLQFAACERSHPDPHARPTRPRVICLNAAELGYHREMARSVGNPFIDLVELAHARRLSASARFDAGKITAADYDVERAQIAADTNSEIASRQNTATTALAAQQQAVAAQQQAASAAIQAGAAIMAPRPPTNTNCQRVGSTVNCQSW